MRYQGKLIEWNDAKGFGFVQPNAGGRKLFVHISEFRALHSGRRPATGDLLSFEIGLDPQRRTCAVQAERVPSLQERQRMAARQQARDARSLLSSMVIVFGALWSFAVIAYGFVVHQPWLVLAAWVTVNGLSLALYGADKSAAESGRRRTPEANLHLLALLGGWPAAALAQRLFNHKSSKADFRVVFWLTMIANVAAMLWLARSGLFASI